MSDAPEDARKPWVKHKPEQRLSVVVSQFLDAALLEPCYKTAINDADGGGRSDQQRARDKERGQEPGQIDWDIVQGTNDNGIMRPLARKLELKRGKNTLSEHQKVTVAKLTACGAPPIVAWTLRAVHQGMAQAGFCFTANVETLLQKFEAKLDAMDREAENVKSGVTPAKPRAARKAAPRVTAGKGFVRRAKAKGIFV